MSYYKNCMLLRLIRCASRRNNGQEITNRCDSTLIAADGRSWIQLFGPMGTFIVDGEDGMTSNNFVEEMRRSGGGPRQTSALHASALAL
eukprot:7636622-Pyramimonas_sp.AAC.1